MPETAEKYKDTTSISVTFPEKDLSTSVNFEIFTGTDGNTYGKLSLGRYMVQYAGQRYLEVTIHDNDVKNGLKIPKSAVIESSFYTIPKEYLTTVVTQTVRGLIRRFIMRTEPAFSSSRRKFIM